MCSLSFVSCEGSHLGIRPDVRLWCEILLEVRQTEGISVKQKQNKSIPLTGASKEAITFRNCSSRKHNHFPFCSGLSQWFKREVMDDLEAAVVKNASRSQGCPFVPDHFASSSLKEAGSFLTFRASCPLGWQQQLPPRQQLLAEEDKELTFPV